MRASSIVPVSFVAVSLFLCAAGASAQQTVPISAAKAAELFTALDANKDGVLSQYEYDSDAIARLIDGDKDQQVSKPEFDALVGRSVDTRSAGHVLVADRNDDGALSDDEVRRGTYRQFKLLDVNHDGNVDRHELATGFSMPVVRP